MSNTGHMSATGEYTTVVIDADSDFLEDLSELLDILGNQTRLKILRSVKNKPGDIRTISNEVGTSYENVKKHLKKLQMAGVVKKESGLSAMTSTGVRPVWKFSLNTGGMESIIRDLTLFSSLNLSLTSPDLSLKLEAVRGALSAGDENTPLLIVLGGRDDGKIYPVSGTVAGIGRYDPGSTHRDSADDIVFPQEYTAITRISRPHAQIIMHDSPGWFIKDCNSTGGTLLNSKLLIPQREYRLSQGDMIDLGRGPGSIRLLVALPRTNTADYNEK